MLADALDWELVEEARNVIEGEADRVSIEKSVRNVNRCVGGILSSTIASKRGAEGLREDSIEITLHGSAGQSFGGWLAPGVSMTLWGDAKRLHGQGPVGRRPDRAPARGRHVRRRGEPADRQHVLYGATSGRAFFRGLAGERFAVRNSGARAVVEGVGDHGCEYMTGGVVAVLGRTGRNFARA